MFFVNAFNVNLEREVVISGHDPRRQHDTNTFGIPTGEKVRHCQYPCGLLPPFIMEGNAKFQLQE